MHPKLTSALAELRRSGANITSSQLAEIVKTKSGTWKGKKSNGEIWSITKNREDSYNNIC